MTPKLTEGWINAINLADVTVETTASLDQTTLEAGLTSDNKLYRVSATKGYNGGKLSKDLEVFQGEIII